MTTTKAIYTEFDPTLRPVSADYLAGTITMAVYRRRSKGEISANTCDRLVQDIQTRINSRDIAL